MGDTLASELGILAKGKPRLVTTWKRVPPGTNGGVSAFGTLASIVGGVIVGLLLAVGLVVENPACRSATYLPELIFWGGVSGFGGSLIDSLLGATLQETKYTGKKISDKGARINGLNILSNSAVNTLSSIMTSVLVGTST